MKHIKHLVGSLLRRTADKVDPKPAPVIHMMGPCPSDLAAKIKDELKRLDRRNGVGLA